MKAYAESGPQTANLTFVLQDHFNYLTGKCMPECKIRFKWGKKKSINRCYFCYYYSSVDVAFLQVFLSLLETAIFIFLNNHTYYTCIYNVYISAYIYAMCMYTYIHTVIRPFVRWKSLKILVLSLKNFKRSSLDFLSVRWFFFFLNTKNVFLTINCHIPKHVYKK